MCVISMVMDKFEPLIPSEDDLKKWLEPYVTVPFPGTIAIQGFPAPEPPKYATQEDIQRLEKLIQDFHTAVTAAKVVDDLTGQPDCIDPEKAKLIERVELLENVIRVLLAK